MEIARAAAGLFLRDGLRATRAEDIARAAGVAPRTFYRYFAGKEEALGPLFAAGAQRWAEAVRSAPAHLSVPEALRQALVATLTPGAGVRYESLDWVRALLRLAEANPALLRVWGEACQTAERTLAVVLADRAAEAAGAADAAPPEAGADGTDAVGGPGAVTRPGPGEEPDAPAASADPRDTDPAGVAGLDPRLRFTAAVATAAVRVAVESWAAGDAAADGPGGPCALALRNLGALDGFPWPAGTP
ncbi:TetR/AcrR family transcriptional regulator [Streptomyces sp. NPDC048566]|uniref:TetR/AcrR family transcriptional regulator n=1 Tax=Streptomyces sp. NPDC048566 TaxID=3365569 RepID=UPI003716403E